MSATNALCEGCGITAADMPYEEENRPWRDIVATLLAAVRDAQQRAEQAEAALEALGRERNTWARQLADLRDERDAANTRAEDEWRKRNEIDNDRTVLTVRAEQAEQALARVRELADQLNREHDGSLVTSDYPLIARRIRRALDGEATDG